jgi:hypothetical protein
MTNAIGDYTASDRYRKGDSIGKRLVSMVPFPDAHFFGYSMGGPTSFGNVIELERAFLDFRNPKYNLSGINNMDTYIGMNIIVRGDVAESPYYNIELKRMKDRLIKKPKHHKLHMEFC